MRILKSALCTLIAILLIIVPFSASAEIATDAKFSLTINAYLKDVIDPNCEYEFSVKCFEMDENDENTTPISTETLKFKGLKTEYTFKNSEVALGGIRYEFEMISVSDKNSAPSSKIFVVYLCGPELIKTHDSLATDEEAEVIYDEISNGLTLSTSFKCTDITPITIDTKSMPKISKVFDGKADAVITNANYKLKGVKDGHDVKLTYTEAKYDSINVAEAKKVTVSGLKLTGEDASKYKLSIDKFDCDAEITVRPITVTAENIVMTKGSAEPELKYTLSEELIEGIQPVGALARTQGTEIGDYAITRGTLSFGPNYEITFIDGTFTISNYSLTGISDLATGIKVSGYFDDKITLSAKQLELTNSAYAPLKESAKEHKIIGAYNLTLSTDIHDGNMTVTFPVDNKYNGREFTVHQLLSNGSIMTTKVVASAGNITISADEITYFMLSTEKTDADSETSIGWLILKIFLIIIGVIAGVVLLIALFFFGMIFFNKTEQLKSIIKAIRKLLKK